MIHQANHGKDTPSKPWGIVGTDVCMLNNCVKYLCIINYNNNFLVMKVMDGIDVQQTNKRPDAKTKETPKLFDHHDDHNGALTESINMLIKTKILSNVLLFLST